MPRSCSQFIFSLIFLAGLASGCASQNSDFPFYHPAINSEKPISLLSKIDEIETIDFDNIRLVTLARDKAASQHLVVVRKGEPPHYHAEHDLWVMVLKGKGEFWLEGTRFEVRPGSSIFIPRGGRHYVTNRGKTPLAAFVVATPPYDGTDTILLDT